jgi:hypothetical protein
MDVRRRKGDFLLTHTDFLTFKVEDLPAAPAAELAVLPVPRKAELDMGSMTIVTIVSLQVQRLHSSWILPGLVGSTDAGGEINYPVSIFGRGLGNFTVVGSPNKYHPAGIVLCNIGGSMFQSEEGWLSTLQRQNTEISKQIFPEKEYQGLSPNFHIHTSVSNLYIPTMGLHILLGEICRPILGLYKSLIDTWMWKLGLRKHCYPFLVIWC